MKSSPVISLQVIAKEVGVSVATVSRVLNARDPSRFSAGTRKRIFDVAERLRYRPNLLAQGIRSGMTRTVGVLIPAIPFYATVIEGIHDELETADFVMILAWNKDDMASPESGKELQYIHRLVDRRVDGVILRPTRDDVSTLYFNEILERKIPFVVVDRELEGVHCDFAGTDDETGGRLAAEHLLQLGHRRLGHFTGPRTVSTARLRWKGFDEAVARFGRKATCRTVEAPLFPGTRELALKLLSGQPRPTAVFCVNDDSAATLYKAADELGLRIPEELSVIGFSDQPFAQYLKPPLTTVRQDAYQIGREAAKLLLARCGIDPKTGRPRKVSLVPELVVRKSTMAPNH